MELCRDRWVSLGSRVISMGISQGSMHQRRRVQCQRNSFPSRIFFSFIALLLIRIPFQRQFSPLSLFEPLLICIVDVGTYDSRCSNIQASFLESKGYYISTRLDRYYTSTSVGRAMPGETFVSPPPIELSSFVRLLHETVLL